MTDLTGKGMESPSREPSQTAGSGDELRSQLGLRRWRLSEERIAITLTRAAGAADVERLDAAMLAFCYALDGTTAWCPIESAPKDGTPILAFCVHPHARYAGEDFASWTEIVTTRWIDFNGGGWTWHGLCGQHTHWMPLPPPPQLPESA